MAQVSTDYVMFLDADDWLEPYAVEQMLSVAAKYPTRYIYSNWWRDNEIIESPPTGYSWCAGTWHPITSLVPSNWVREVDGFDETMPGGEDTDFYLRLTTSFRCGIRLATPLVHYSPDGQRAKMFHNSPEFKVVMSKLTEKYGGKMSCCGKKADMNETPMGQRQPGDVLAYALWGGNRKERGRATNRRYPRTGNGKTVWVAPADIKASPRLWKAVPAVELADAPLDLENDIPVVTNVQQVANAVMPIMRPRLQQYKPTAERGQQATPDIDAIVRMGQERLG
jgi:hypothetical protein